MATCRLSLVSVRRGYSLVAASRGYSLVSVHAGFSLKCLLWLQSTALGHKGFSSCGSWALKHRLSGWDAQDRLLCSMWDLPGPGTESISPALQGGFLTTGPPGKPYISPFYRDSGHVGSGATLLQYDLILTCYICNDPIPK